MPGPGTEFGLKLMQAVGAQTGVTYLSAPVSTGRRDLILMRELGVSKAQLRQQFAHEYVSRVIRANEREAAKFAQMVRGLKRGRMVINPAELSVPGWSQADYMQFWEETIRSFSLEMVLAPGWEYSSGARHEATIALQTQLIILDVRGNELSAADLMAIDARGRESLLADGFAPELVLEYVPFIDYVKIQALPGSPQQSVQQLARVAWESRSHIKGHE